MNTLIIPATGDRRIAALRLLFSRFPEEDQEARVRDALIASERGTLHLEHLLVAESAGQAVGSALVMVQTDGVALVWPPIVDCGDEDPRPVEDLLMQSICERIDEAGARLGQCLLAPENDVEAVILNRHGFERATDMFFMARPITGTDLATDPAGTEIANAVSVETYGPENHTRFVRLIEETYKGSLDCPYLNGLRTGEEAVVSHKLSGQFDPTQWALYQIGGEDAGVLLMNDHGDQDAVELVYLGVKPMARGQGLGRRMLRQGLCEAAQRARAVIFLAVDCDNLFANALYGEFEFTELARRRVMLRRRSGLARQ